MRSVMTAGPGPTRPFGWLIAVLMRMSFALVLAGAAGTAGALSAGLSGAALEVLEESEDERPVQEEGVRVCVRVARAARAGASSHARVIAQLEIPRELTPTVSIPPTPSWQRPRRTAPDDDAAAAAQV